MVSNMRLLVVGIQTAVESMLVAVAKHATEQTYSFRGGCCLKGCCESGIGGAEPVLILGDDRSRLGMLGRRGGPRCWS